MEKKKKVYIKGVAKEIVFSGGGSLINFSVNVPQLVKILGLINSKREKAGLAETEYIPLVIQEKFNGETDDWGNTHNVTLDLFRAEPRAPQKESHYQKPKKEKKAEAGADDLPF